MFLLLSGAVVLNIVVDFSGLTIRIGAGYNTKLAEVPFGAAQRLKMPVDLFRGSLLCLSRPARLRLGPSPRRGQAKTGRKCVLCL